MNNESKKLRLTFCGGAGMVTGANFLIEELPLDSAQGKKFLIDCGLIQGEKVAEDKSWAPFSYDPAKIDALFVTHAHADHIGRIPKLIHEGFRGKIYSTLATKDLSEVMLFDANKILSRNKKFDLKKIYNKENLKRAMELWEGVQYHQTINLQGGFEALFKEAGHILGSAMVEIKYNESKIVFTGDLGNSPSPLLPDTEKISDANYLIMESVYGDRNHEPHKERRKMLEKILEDNFKNNGTLIIPIFTLERSQELLFEINNLVENKRVPIMPIFFDSPLAIILTDVFKKHQSYFNKKAQALISTGDNIFHFPGLRMTFETEESKLIKEVTGPKVIIAGAGMSTGGRILHHEKNYLPDPKNTILLTGYQALGSLGRRIEDGAKKVKIFGSEIEVKAKVVTIKGYSGHKDLDNLVNFVQDSADSLDKVFVVMGEPKSSMFLSQRIMDYLGIKAYVPKMGESVEIEV